MKGHSQNGIYKNVSKAVTLVLYQICIITVAVSGAWALLTFIQMDGDISLRFGEDIKYEDSERFNNLFESQLYELVEYIQCKSLFETDGVYDGQKAINIAYYAEQMLGYDTQYKPWNIEYRLDDLIKWSQTGWEIDEGYPVEELGIYIIDTVEQKTESVETTDADTSIALAAVPYQEAAPASGESLTVKHLQEACQPIDMDSLYPFYDVTFVGAHAREEAAFLIEEVNGYTEVMDAILQQISGQFKRYRQLESKFAQGYTNLNYIIMDFEESLAYSNIVDIPAGSMEISEAALDELKEKGKYYILDSRNLSYDTNTTISDTVMYDMLTNYAHIFAGEYYVAAAVNTRYPFDDAFALDRKPFVEGGPWTRFLLLLMICSTVVGLALFIILTCQAGRNPENREIALNRFDRIKTELAAGGMTVIGAALILAYIWVVGAIFRSNTPVFVIMVGIFAFVANSAFLTGYLSLVRRIKAGTLWSNSLIAWFLKLVESAIKNARHSVRIVVVYVFYVGLLMFALRIGKVTFILALFLAGFVGVKLLEHMAARRKILEGAKTIAKGNFSYEIDTANLRGDMQEMAETLNNIGQGMHSAIEHSLKNERLKTDLITNVSHDIKTPLTSIINYVDLLKREDIQDEKIRGYINILEDKSQRLKHLTEDLVEVSKVSSGNIVLNMTNLNFVELIYQTAGEFSEKFADSRLELITKVPEQPVVIYADSRRIWRVVENLYNNVAKYAMPGTRVYADLTVEDDMAVFSLKNISAQPLNIRAEELTERFIRGDVSRSTEGSGLGLSIARSLVEAQKGEFSIYLDGDLFKATVRFSLRKTD